MPDKIFLEEYPLYRKFSIKINPTVDEIGKTSIHMYCSTCKSEQTYKMINDYWLGYKYSNTPSKGTVVIAKYICLACENNIRYFLIYISSDLSNIMKVGQYPPWEISVDKKMSDMLKEHIDNYKKGLTCESQGYGIGAYAYYRRIVENIIDTLLDSIQNLLSNEEKEKYSLALEETKNTIVAVEKISLVKDLLPQSLRPNGMNPLNTLHSILSEGIHEKSEDECLELAGNIRNILTYLVDQTIRAEESSRIFTESMKNLLDKKAQKLAEKPKKE